VDQLFWEFAKGPIADIAQDLLGTVANVLCSDDDVVMIPLHVCLDICHDQF
jgi:hypothetical protein